MNSNAEMIYEQISTRSSIISVNQITSIRREEMRNPGIYVLSPFEDLYRTNPLEHSWRVSSDSISLYYAKKVKSPICVLIKNQPYLKQNGSFIRSISSTQFIISHSNKNELDGLGKGLIDPLSPILCRKYDIPIILLDGTNIEHVARFFSLNLKREKISNFSKYGIVIFPN